MSEKTQNVVEVKNLCKYFPIKAGLFGRVVGHVHAVEDVSFNIKRGTTMGLVGESGCGKTTIGKTILHLTEKTRTPALPRACRFPRSSARPCASTRSCRTASWTRTSPAS